MRAKVTITPRKSVLDPQGRAVCGSLHAMGFAEVADVRVGRFIELALDLKGDGKSAADRARIEKRLDEMCRQLLANTLIEDYRVELET